MLTNNILFYVRLASINKINMINVKVVVPSFVFMPLKYIEWSYSNVTVCYYRSADERNEF